MKYLRAALACALVTFASQAAPAATPVPGGANQVSALSAKLGQTVFNGVLRITVSEVREATSADNPQQMNTTPAQKVMILSALLRNGSKDEFTDLMTYSLADKDDISVVVPSSDMHPGNLHILQGAAARQTAMFVVDKDFVPVKLIVQCATCGKSSGFRAVRFTL